MAVNPGMIRVFEKLGLVQEGAFRQQDRIDDEDCYAIISTSDVLRLNLSALVRDIRNCVTS